MVGGREVGEGSGGGFGQGGGSSEGLGSGQWGNLRPREDESHVSVQAMKEAYGIGTGRGARSVRLGRTTTPESWSYRTKSGFR